MEQKKILVAVDASAQSFEAVRYVGHIMPVGQAHITLFHVLELIPESFWDLEASPLFHFQTGGLEAWEFLQRKMIEEFMDRAKGLLSSIGFADSQIDVIVRSREVGIARDIAKEAQKGYDALVVGRRGMGELEELVLGSIANKLISLVQRVPVWVVGGHPETHRMLIAMDRSEGSMRALEYVESIFDVKHPELLLFHVTRGIAALYAGFDLPLHLQRDSDWLERANEEFKRAEKEMNALFGKCVRDMEKRGADIGKLGTKIVPGVYSRAGAIFSEAQEGGYGTIVVGRRGLSRVEEFIMGRVSSKVLQLAQEMAVWVVH